MQWFTRTSDDRGELAAEVVSDDLTEEGYRHVVIAIRSTLATDAWANPMFVLRDMSGTLLGVREGWAAVPAGAEVGAEALLFFDVESSANISVQADVDWSDDISGGAPTNPPPGVRPLEVVEAGLSWSDDDLDPGTSWAALPSETRTAIAGSHRPVQVTANIPRRVGPDRRGGFRQQHRKRRARRDDRCRHGAHVGAFVGDRRRDRRCELGSARHPAGTRG